MAGRGLPQGDAEPLIRRTIRGSQLVVNHKDEVVKTLLLASLLATTTLTMPLHPLAAAPVTARPAAAPTCKTAGGVTTCTYGVTPVRWSGWCESSCGPQGWAGRLHHHDEEEETHA